MLIGRKSVPGKQRTAGILLTGMLLLCLMLISAAQAEIRETDTGIILGYTPDFSGVDASETRIIYGAPDMLGRCTAALAVLGKDMRQPQERENISEYRPTGFHNASYGFVRDRWVYHRCHLIGRQLGGADEPVNLFTGTRTLNCVQMLYWENQIAAYIRKTGKRVFYRAAPQYAGDDLLCTSVLLEAMSAEDGGRGLCFAVLCLNQEAGVAIDYPTGYTTRADHWESGGTQIGLHHYVINEKSGRFHLPDCEDAQKVALKNRQERKCLRGLLLSEGLVPCGKCRP